jgi:hypothetical protein
MKKLLILLVILPVISYGQKNPRIKVVNNVDAFPIKYTKLEFMPTLIDDGDTCNYQVSIEKQHGSYDFKRGWFVPTGNKTIEARHGKYKTIVYYTGEIKVDSIKQYWNGKPIN